MLHRIEPFEFDARVSRTELPVHCADSLVAMILPTLHLPTEFLDGGEVVGQTLLCQNTQFDLGNVELTGMLGGVVDFQAVDEGFSLLWWKDFVERSGCARIEIV